MMILSRTWYVILALLLAAAYYVVSLAVGQYNRRNQVASDETVRADSQVVSWAMQVDARKRADTLILSSSEQLVKALGKANGPTTAPVKDIPADAKDEAAKALRAFNEKLPAEYRHDALMVTDRDGRLGAQINYDQLNAAPEFELGGYPAVNDALHGFIRDDTWVLGGKLARIVTRPIEGEVGQPPLGAVVGIKWVDNAYAKEIGRRTRTTIAFFTLGSKVASAALEGGGLDDNIFDGNLASEFAKLMDDKDFKATGRTDVRPLPEDKGGVIYVRIPGDAWDLGAGFAVARPKVFISSPMGFVQGADDQDKRNVKLWLVAVVILGAALIGIFFSYLEHSMPMRELASQGDKLKRGEIDQLQLPRFRGGYRPIATDINTGIQRVIEKGGGTARKPADLESILGPVPAQPSMSAFSFPMNDGSGVGPTPPIAPPSGGGLPPPALAQTGGNRTAPGFPGGPGAAPAGPPPVGSRPGAPPPINAPGASPATRPGFQGNDRTMAMPGAPPPFPGGNSPAAGVPHSATVAASPAAAAAAKAQLGTAGTVPAAFPPNNNTPMPKEEEEQTMVAQPSADLISQTAAGVAADPAAEWQAVYQEFIRTKQQCGEPTEGLTFEKFQQTLKKNRDALMQRHGCKRVKFSVYVKEGRASLKATPVRE